VIKEVWIVDYQVVCLLVRAYTSGHIHTFVLSIVGYPLSILVTSLYTLVAIPLQVCKFTLVAILLQVCKFETV
jgi:hypothetical protein